MFSHILFEKFIWNLACPLALLWEMLFIASWQSKSSLSAKKLLRKESTRGGWKILNLILFGADPYSFLTSVRFEKLFSHEFNFYHTWWQVCNFIVNFRKSFLPARLPTDAFFKSWPCHINTGQAEWAGLLQACVKPTFSPVVIRYPTSYYYQWSPNLKSAPAPHQ